MHTRCAPPSLPSGRATLVCGENITSRLAALMRQRTPDETKVLLWGTATLSRLSQLHLAASGHLLHSNNPLLPQAASLLPRLASLYSMADLVAHVSAEDLRAERRSFPFVSRWALLRTPLQNVRVTQEWAPGAKRVFSQTRHVGFLGNGQTATNHQAQEVGTCRRWSSVGA